MSDFRFRRLERHRVGGSRDRIELSYRAPRSPSGKVYPYSPNPDAAPRLFLLGDAPENRAVASEQRRRILREPGPGHTVCPYSGFVAPDEEFVHFDDVEAIKKQVLWMAEADVQDYLADWAKDFNRRQPRNSFIRMEMEFKPSRSPRPPLAIREDLLRNLTCDVCQRRARRHVRLRRPSAPRVAEDAVLDVGVAWDNAELYPTPGAASLEGGLDRLWAWGYEGDGERVVEYLVPTSIGQKTLGYVDDEGRRRRWPLEEAVEAAEERAL